MSDPYDIRPAIISQGMKTFMTFIDRVGFPIVVTVILSYILYRTILTNEALNLTLTKQTVVLQAVADRLGIRVVHDAPPDQKP